MYSPTTLRYTVRGTLLDGTVVEAEIFSGDANFPELHGDFKVLHDCGSSGHWSGYGPPENPRSDSEFSEGMEDDSDSMRDEQDNVGDGEEDLHGPIQTSNKRASGDEQDKSAVESPKKAKTADLTADALAALEQTPSQGNESLPRVITITQVAEALARELTRQRNGELVPPSVVCFLPCKNRSSQNGSDGKEILNPNVNEPQGETWMNLFDDLHISGKKRDLLPLFVDQNGNCVLEVGVWLRSFEMISPDARLDRMNEKSGAAENMKGRRERGRGKPADENYGKLEVPKRSMPPMVSAFREYCYKRMRYSILSSQQIAMRKNDLVVFFPHYPPHGYYVCVFILCFLSSVRQATNSINNVNPAPDYN